MTDERKGLPSASGADRFYHCSASHAMEQSAPREESKDPLAAEGTLIHEALEMDDDSGLNLNQKEIAAKIAEVEKMLFRQWREEFPIKDKGMEIKEERYWIYGDDGQETGSAKPDLVHIIGDHALVLDIKTGYLLVKDASRNLQGRLQALAVWQNNPEVVHVRSAFAQYRFKKHYTYCDYTKKDLEYALFEWNATVWKSRQPDAPETPGPWCNGCRAKGFCRTAGSYSLLPSATIGGKVGVKKADVEAAVSSLSVPDMVAIYERRSIITNVLVAVSDRLKALPESDLKELGYEFKDGASYITHVDVAKLFPILFDEKIWDHITEDEREREAKADFRNLSTLKVTDARKWVVEILVEKQKRFRTKKAAEEWFDEVLARVSQTDIKERSLKKIRG